MSITVVPLLEDKEFLEKRIADQRAYISEYGQKIRSGKVTRPDYLDVLESAEGRLYWFEWVLSIRLQYEPYGSSKL
jgi:hypothetical protein